MEYDELLVNDKLTDCYEHRLCRSKLLYPT